MIDQVMPGDHTQYNATVDLIERNLAAGRGGKIAYIDDAGSTTYAQLAERVDRAANALRGLGIKREQRIAIAMLDSADWAALFLGAIKAGVVPVALNTLLTRADYEYQLQDSRARAVVVSSSLQKTFEGIQARCPHLKYVINDAHLKDLLATADSKAEAAGTMRDDMCFWLYSSGSTGAPKGTVHLHSHLIATADLYARPVLGIRESDVVFSAAKLFFAYGLGNAMTFPLAVGATTVLMAERPTPDAVFKRLVEKKPTIFYGVPTLYAALLASQNFPERKSLNLRVCTSAGEALPAEIEVGTVDKFQGREAPVVLFSMASSSGEDVPRGLEFLFSRNRFNVAISRAKAIAVVVCSPRLMDVRCRSVEQMRLVNAVCAFAERATREVS